MCQEFVHASGTICGRTKCVSHACVVCGQNHTRWMECSFGLFVVDIQPVCTRLYLNKRKKKKKKNVENKIK